MLKLYVLYVFSWFVVFGLGSKNKENLVTAIPLFRFGGRRKPQ